MASFVGRSANVCAVLFVFFICLFFETFSFSFLSFVVASVEKAFDLPIRLARLLVAVSDIGFLLTIVVLAYHGAKRNRARWIGVGCALIAFSCLLVALPHFAFPNTAKTIIDNTHRMRHISEGDIAMYMIKFKKDEGKGDLLGGKPEGNGSVDNSVGIDFGNIDDEVEKATLAPWVLQWMKEEEEREEAEARKKANMTTLETTTVTTTTTTTTIAPSVTPARYDASYFIRGESLNRVNRAASLKLFICNPIVQRLKTALEEDRCAPRHPNVLALVMILVGVAFIGVGHSLPWTLGIPMIDDHVKKTNMPLFFGGVFFFHIIGPVLGLVIGGILSQMYFTLQAPPPGITPLDLSWIGAWWPAYLFLGLALAIPAFVLILCPRVKRESENTAAVMSLEYRAKARRSAAVCKNNGAGNHCVLIQNTSSGSFVVESRSFGSSIGAILGRKLFVIALLARIADAFAAKGFFAFLPRFLEVHYGYAKSYASLLLGGTSVLGFGVGIALGAGITRCTKLQGRKAAALVAIATALGVLFAFTQAGLGCQTLHKAAGDLRASSNGSLTNACNRDCWCENATAYPVCSKNGTLYYSPCHAGCRNVSMENKIKFKLRIFECTCTDVWDEVSPDWCATDCGMMGKIYLVFSLLTGLVWGASFVPSALIIMRSVPVDVRSMALGLGAFLISLLSTFPSPFIYDYVHTSACLDWSTDCDRRGACSLYDPQALRVRIHTFLGGLRIVAFLFDLWVVYLASGLKLFECTPAGGDAVVLSGHVPANDDLHFYDEPHAQLKPVKPVGQNATEEVDDSGYREVL